MEHVLIDVRAPPPGGAAQQAEVETAVDQKRLQAFLGRYLSEAHRDAPATGCPVPSLASNVPRQPPSVRRAFTAGVQGLLARIAKLAPGADPGDQVALLGGVVGALALARAVDDEALSERLLDESRAFWTRTLGPRPSRATAHRRGRGGPRRKRAVSRSIERQRWHLPHGERDGRT